MNVSPRHFFIFIFRKEEGEDYENEGTVNPEAYQQYIPSHPGKASNNLDKDDNVVLTWHRVDTPDLTLDANMSAMVKYKEKFWYSCLNVFFLSFDIENL